MISRQKGGPVDHLFAVAEQFQINGRIVDIREYGSGNVNDTFLVELHGGDGKIILQRINSHVFSQPEHIMLNMRVVSEHVRARLENEAALDGGRWEMPRIFPAKDGRDYVIDAQGAFWRAISFIDCAVTYETIRDSEHARQAGYALGRFHRLLSDLKADALYDTLPGFHSTPGYLKHYDRVLRETGSAKPAADVDYCKRFVLERREFAQVLEEARKRKKLLPRPVHGDPKVSNIMIDTITGKAVSIIDLDTVKPGLIHYDLGDCLRSCCNPAGEEAGSLDDVSFEIELLRVILTGYLAEADSFLTDNDYAYFYDAVRLIAFELGLRFFTDYLEGNRYFKARRRDHNLQRALAQFRLVREIEAQENAIRSVIKELQ